MSTGTEPDTRARPRRPRRHLAGPLTRAFAWSVVRLRWLVVAGWIVAAVAATQLLPTVARSSGPAVGDLVPEDAESIRTEIESLRRFRVPVLSRVAVVQRDPEGLSNQAQARVLARAVQLFTAAQAARERGVEPPTGIAGALPVTNAFGLVPGSRERSTTAITFLYFEPGTPLATQVERARGFAQAAGEPDDALVGVTGAIPARLRQNEIVLAALPWVEVASVGAVALILALYFRSLGPPLVTLGAAGVAYLVSVRVVAWAGERLDLTLPKDLEPVIVVLLLGIVTDYSIFFLTGFRQRVAAGEARIPAAKGAVAGFAPIVVTAGLIVAAGSAALLAATVGFLRAFGPGLALTVLVSLAVAITLVPAALAIFGRALFWPRRYAMRPEPNEDHAPVGWRTGAARRLTVRPVAALAALLGIGLLLAASSGLSRAELGFTLISGLPPDSEERRAADAAAQGFAPGVLSPTEVVITGTGLHEQGDRLADLQLRMAGEAGVAGVLGPNDQLAQLAPGLLVTEDGTAARLVVILEQDPLGGDAIDALRALRGRMPDLLAAAGLPGAEAAFAGDTALAAEAVDRMLHDLVRIAVVALAIDLVLLVIFLRGLVAPLYLLAASALGLAAALGLTTFVFQVVVGRADLTYYVPFGTAILLLSLGSDYNVFVVGRIWDEAKVRPLRDAVAVAAPRAARTISVAGIVLAASFALLALVPLIEFREFAFAMAAGILIDTFLVRSVLVPALVTLFGRASWWPARAPRPSSVAP